MGLSRGVIQVLITALALLAIALAGAGSHSSTPRLQQPAQVVVGAHPNDAGDAGLVVTRATGHLLQTPTWSGSGVGTDAAGVLTASLLGSLLLALVRFTRPPSQSAQPLPPRRAPPQVAFVH
jgi:hypothetical protein